MLRKCHNWVQWIPIDTYTMDKNKTGVQALLSCLFLVLWACSGNVNDVPLGQKNNPGSPENSGTSINSSCPDYNTSILPEPLPEEIRTSTVGGLHGDFQVTDDGVATYSIPLNLPPGVNGLSPSIGITYDHLGPNGLLGVGFSLSGMSSISRCPRTQSEDGYHRGLWLDGADRLCLDGLPLLLESGFYGQTATYVTKPNSFSKVISQPNPQFPGQIRFQVYQKDGHIATYGGTSDSQQLGGPSTVAWHLSKLEDRHGNFSSFTYKNEKQVVSPAGDPSGLYFFTKEFFIEKIEYTGNFITNALPTRKVEFVYENRPDVSEFYYRGFKRLQHKRLSKIEVRASGTIYRSYRLNYENNGSSKKSKIVSIQECSRNEVCTSPTYFSWNLEQEGFFPKVTTSNVKHPGAIHTVLDIDGDGRDDVLYPQGMNAGWLASFASGASGVLQNPTVTGLTYTGPITSGGIFGYGIPMDFTQDGRTDYFVFSSQQRPYHAISFGLDNYGYAVEQQGSNDLWNFINIGGVDETPSMYSRKTFADLNGDQIEDLLECGGPLPNWSIRFHNGSNFDPPIAIPILDPVPCYSNTRPPVFDVDGDGVADVLLDVSNSIPQPFSLPGWGILSLYWNRAETSEPTYRFVDSRLPPFIGDSRIFLDVNGDGLKDIVMSSKGVGKYLEIFLNEGNGFQTSPYPAMIPSSLGEDFFYSNDGILDAAVAIDYDHDGREDLLIPQGDPNVSTIPRTLLLLRSVGERFERTSVQIPFFPNGEDFGDPQSALYKGIRVADFNGDGAHDLLIPSPSGTLEVYLHRWDGNKRQGETISSIQEGKGGLSPSFPNKTVELSYAPLVEDALGTPGEERFYSKGTACKYPLRCVVDGSLRVQIEKHDSGPGHPLRVLKHSYEAGHSERFAGRWLGFKRHRINEQAKQHIIERLFDNETFDHQEKDFIYARLLKQETSTTYLENGLHIRDTLNQWQKKTKSLSLEPIAASTYFMYGSLTSELAHSSETQGAGYPNIYRSELEQEVDNFGNTTHSKVQRSAPGSPTYIDISDYSHLNDVTSWLLGLELSASTSSRVAYTWNENSQQRLVTSTYDDKGKLTSSTSYKTASIPTVSTTYSYDQRGNRVAIRSQDTQGNFRESCVTYDPEGLFPFARRNPEGHISYISYDPLHGVPVVSMDASGLISRQALDAFGRVTRVENADGSVQVIRFSLADNPVHASYPSTKIETSILQGTASTVYLDHLGRIIREETKGPSGEDLYRSTYYDQFGRVFAQKEPANAADPITSHFTYHFYDNLDRLRKLEAPDGSTSQFSYDARKTIQTSPLLHKVETIYDAAGNVQQVKDAKNGITQYTYGPFEDVLSMRTPKGVVTAFNYDNWGKVTRVLDPNLGNKSITYDGFGEIETITDAKGQLTTFTHDRIGRIRSITNPEGTESFFYDQSPQGIGNLSKAIRSDGTQTSFLYNEKGQLSQRDDVIDGETFSIRSAYDSYGRISRIIYPDPAQDFEPFSVRFEYSNFGHVNSIKDLRNSKELWRRQQTDARGNIIKELFGNNVSTTYSHRVDNGRIEGISTQGASVNPSLNFQFDLHGNLKSRSFSGTDPFSESFTYDPLDRLARVVYSPRRSSSQVTDLSYDADGNVVTRSGLGNYTYHPTSVPHAVQQIGSNSYSYDANGNQIQRPGFTIRWTPENKIREIYKVGATYRGPQILYGYNALQERVLKYNAETGTKTLYAAGGLYEKRIKTGPGPFTYQLHRFYVPTPSGSTILVWTNTSTISAPWQVWGTEYNHSDHLFSPFMITDQDGQVVAEQSYDAFGKKRIISTSNPKSSLGYTGHEDEEDAGLINMQGRMFDPNIARFISPDPIIQAPTFSQSLNRYSYVWNNPLSFTDPSGYSAVSPEKQISREESYNSDGALVVGKPSQTSKSNHNEKPRATVAPTPAGTPAKPTAAPSAGATSQGGHTLPRDWSDHFMVNADTGIQVTLGLAAAAGGVALGAVAAEAGVAAGLARGVASASQAASRFWVTLAPLAGARERLRDAMQRMGAAGQRTLSQAANFGQRAVNILRQGTNPITQSRKCFAAGTLVWTSAGLIPIEQIQVGDLVLSRDDVTGESSWQSVEETFVTPETELLDLELAWPGGGETLRVTSEHPIWVKGEGWVEAGSLRSGDHIASADAGGWATVQSLRGPPGKETVYNLSVAKSHTYFVGSGGTWVHNGGPCGEEELVTLWKAVPPRRTAAIAEEEVKSGFPVNRYPGMGPFFSLEKSVAEKYRYHYQNGMQEIILPKSHYDRMFSSGLIKIDGLEQSSVHVPASGLDRFNQAIQLGPANKYHPEVP
jgi:RHS repeat-associated protein